MRSTEHQPEYTTQTIAPPIEAPAETHQKANTEETHKQITELLETAAAKEDHVQLVTQNPHLSDEAKTFLINLINTQQGPWDIEGNITGIREENGKITLNTEERTYEYFLETKINDYIAKIFKRNPSLSYNTNREWIENSVRLQDDFWKIGSGEIPTLKKSGKMLTINYERVDENGKKIDYHDEWITKMQ